MVGHSTGEHSAAIAGGVLDVETDERLRAFCEGLHNSYADAASRHDIPRAVLLALGTDGGRGLEIAGDAGGELHLAMDNCPHQAVLVGEPAAIDRAREVAAREGIVAEVLPYDRAVHTPLFAPFAEDLRSIFAELPVGPARTPLWSCTTAAPYPDDPAADPRAAGRALDQPGSLPRDDRGAPRGRRTGVRRGRSARQHDLLHRGHPARSSLLRGGIRRAAPLRASPSSTISSGSSPSTPSTSTSRTSSRSAARTSSTSMAAAPSRPQRRLRMFLCRRPGRCCSCPPRPPSGCGRSP